MLFYISLFSVNPNSDLNSQIPFSYLLQLCGFLLSLIVRLCETSCCAYQHICASCSSSVACKDQKSVKDTVFLSLGWSALTYLCLPYVSDTSVTSASAYWLLTYYSAVPLWTVFSLFLWVVAFVLFVYLFICCSFSFMSIFHGSLLYRVCFMSQSPMNPKLNHFTIVQPVSRMHEHQFHKIVVALRKFLFSAGELNALTRVRVYYKHVAFRYI